MHVLGDYTTSDAVFCLVNGEDVFILLLLRTL